MSTHKKITKKNLFKTYDYIIVGGGIAGLYTSYKIHKNYPNAKICLIESNNRLGGRLHSITSPEGSIYEAGGARFNTDQHRILELIKELQLESKIIPISSDVKYIPVNINYDKDLETTFPDIDTVISKINSLITNNKITDHSLINTTLLKFAKKYMETEYPTLSKYLEAIYPYYSELGILNAKDGISLFQNEFNSKTKYFILAGGLEQLITNLHNLLKKHITIYLETSLENIEQSTNSRYKITTTNEKHLQLFANNIILAIQRPSLIQLQFLKKIKPLLNSITNQSLYRIYARYPKQNGSVWFKGLGKINTNLQIKYIIPYDEENGIIMISYTDSKYAEYWMNQLTNDTLEEQLYKQLKIIFPDKNIPQKPLWIKHYYWAYGAGYWKPGFYSDNFVHKVIKPMKNKNVYICGENYSHHQAWVEGALETSDLVLTEINNSKNNNSKNNNSKNNNSKNNNSYISGGARKNTKGKSLKKYTMEEVAKHNNRNDAWIVIDNMVIDITKWIPKHPGGDIILTKVGKNSTKLFHTIHQHSENAKKIMLKYQIGYI